MVRSPGGRRRRQPPAPKSAGHTPALHSSAGDPGGRNPALTADDSAQRGSARAGDEPGGRSSVQAVYASPDGRYLAIMSRWGTLSVHSIRRGKLGPVQGTFQASPVRRVSFAEPAGLMAFVTPDSVARVVRLEDMAVMLSTPGTVTALSADGAWLAAVLADGEREQGDMLQIRDIAGRYDPVMTVLDGYFSALAEGGPHLAFSPGGRWLAVTGRSGMVDVIERDTLQSAFAVRHADAITGLDWLRPDVLATSSADGTIRIWDVQEFLLLRIVELGGPAIGMTYAAARDALIGWTDGEYQAWAGVTGRTMSPVILAGGGLPAHADFLDRPVAATADAIVLAGPSVTNIEFRPWEPGPAACGPAVSTYANAKVLLVGDSGVGKSGLAMVLAGEPFQATESTHARRIWKLPAGSSPPGTLAQREVMLWDLAGQPGYRIVHQLHLRDGAAALILFDSRSETAPLAGIGHWARALRHAQGGGLLPTFLVAARIDRGVVAVSDERIAAVVTEFGFRGCLPTSALESWGVPELRAAVLAAIDWEQIPVVTSSALFAAAKSFVLEQKASGTLLTPLPALCGEFLGAPVTGPAAQAAGAPRTGRDLMDDGGGDEARLRSVFEGCVDRLESAGLVRRLAFGDMVLLQPELIDIYAGAVVNAARAEPDGLGCLLESRALAVDFPIPEAERVPDAQQERLLIIATLEELIRHEIVLREHTDEGALLVFPSAFRRDLPAADEPDGYTAEFSFEGPVDNVYATLVVRLARSDRFSRLGAWQSAVQFANADGRCTLRLAMAQEGCGTLRVGYDEVVPELVQVQFERFVQAHLDRRATPGTVRRRRQYACPDCGSPFSAAQVVRALDRRREAMICPACETRVSLDDPFTRLGQRPDAVTRQMDASADSALSRAAASSVILGKEETTDFDVFLCHNVGDKPAVRDIGRQLRERGVLPWLDENDLQPGLPWQDELERQIASIRAAAVFVGPGGLGPWQNHELRAFLRQFAERGCPVIPVLLPGAEAPDLPVFLSAMTWVDLRDPDPAAIDRLIWGITGEKQGRLHPEAL